jgi:hypothetical protein
MLVDRVVLSPPSALVVGEPMGLEGSAGLTFHPDDDPSPSSYAFTPAQIRAAYRAANIAVGGVTGDGTGQTVAIVDAYDDPRQKRARS